MISLCCTRRGERGTERCRNNMLRPSTNHGTLWMYNVVDGDGGGDKEDEIIDGADRDNYDYDDVLRFRVYEFLGNVALKLTG